MTTTSPRAKRLANLKASLRQLEASLADPVGYFEEGLGRAAEKSLQAVSERRR